MSLAVLCINVLARYPDQLPNQTRIHSSPVILDAFANTRDPSTWATLAQLVHPLPPHCHDLDLSWSHPALPSLQRINDTPDFSLVTILSLPNCSSLRDDDIASLRTLHRLVALDLRGCSISSYPLTALSRGLVHGGPLALRLLRLHGCPNIDDDILPALVKFPLLSALDLRFTRCSPSAVHAYLSSLGFHPSANSSLFHPAPISSALCSLEKVARSAPHPILLYSCPPQSVFRIHIHDLPFPSRSKKVVPVHTSHSESAIRAISSTVVFIPPPRKPSEVMPSITPVVPVDRSIDQPVSNASSFYDNTSTKKRILPFSAQAIQSSKGGRLDPLAIARSPPPWTILDMRASSDNAPVARSSGQALDKPLKVDRARLHKRGSDAVADLVHQSAKKRLKVKSEFALEKLRIATSVKPRNPFARSIKSVFVECISDKPPSSSLSDTKPDIQLRTSRSLPSKTSEQQQAIMERAIKPLKPITTLKPPILPKELLPSTPRHTSKFKTELKQARLSFS
ncbi:hypothetical protein JVU11DRAFT_563 [Chiua virens]|nr:hypothetical protein JVU11DRAFT_563 [Chiua virens]